MLTDNQVLKLILCYAREAEQFPERQTRQDKLLSEIYKIAHSHLKSTCYKVHKDWRLEAEDKFNKLNNMSKQP